MHTRFLPLTRAYLEPSRNSGLNSGRLSGIILNGLIRPRPELDPVGTWLMDTCVDLYVLCTPRAQGLMLTSPFSHYFLRALIQAISLKLFFSAFSSFAVFLSFFFLRYLLTPPTITAMTITAPMTGMMKRKSSSALLFHILYQLQRAISSTIPPMMKPKDTHRL